MYNVVPQRAIGKILLICQVGDPKSQATCYIIDEDTSYNMLLDRQ